MVRRAARLLHFRIGPAAALGNEALDAGLQHRQRHRAELEHRVVEGADVESLSECLLSPRPSLKDGALAEVVRERLPGPGDVAVDLGADLALWQRGVLAEIVERLLARPPLGVDAGVDYQARRAPDLVAEHAEAVVGRVVHAHLAAELLAVERPALPVGGDVSELAEGGLILVLHRDRDLEG